MIEEWYTLEKWYFDAEPPDEWDEISEFQRQRYNLPERMTLDEATAAADKMSGDYRIVRVEIRREIVKLPTPKVLY